MAANPKKTAADSPSPDGVVYLEQHLRGVDNGRIILPPEWRRADFPKDLTGILWPLPKPEYVLVLAPARWETMRRNLAEQSLGDERAAALERLLGIRTFRRSLDAYGRFPLSEDALRILGLKEEALLAGRVDKFEVWNPETFKAKYTEPDEQLIADAMKYVKL